MATGTNTVVLFLKKRNDKFFEKTKSAVEETISTLKDNTINGIEKPISEYVNRIWGTLSLKDYQSLLKKSPNETVQAQYSSLLVLLCQVMVNHSIIQEMF